MVGDVKWEAVRKVCFDMNMTIMKSGCVVRYRKIEKKYFGNLSVGPDTMFWSNFALI